VVWCRCLLIQVLLLVLSGSAFAQIHSDVTKPPMSEQEFIQAAYREKHSHIKTYESYLAYYLTEQIRVQVNLREFDVDDLAEKIGEQVIHLIPLFSSDAASDLAILDWTLRQTKEMRYLSPPEKYDVQRVLISVIGNLPPTSKTIWQPDRIIRKSVPNKTFLRLSSATPSEVLKSYLPHLERERIDGVYQEYGTFSEFLGLEPNIREAISRQRVHRRFGNWVGKKIQGLRDALNSDKVFFCHELFK
jgi:hypothetical protein